jgi:VWFA-related protein
MLPRPRTSLLSILLLGSVVAVISAPLNGQIAASDGNERPVFKANARTVVLDVVVTGKSGRPIEGLHKEDFLAEEDGHPQNITFFEEHRGVQPVRAASLPKLPPNVFINVPRMTPADAVTVLLLDALNTPLSDQSNVRAKMLKYLKELQPGHRMAIFTLSTRLRFVEGFTDDPAMLAAILSNQKGGAGPVTSAVLQSKPEIASNMQTTANMAQGGALDAAAALRQFFAEQSASQDALRTDMTLEAFQELARYLAGIPGRKNLVWFSSAFPLVLLPNQDLTDAFAVDRNFGDKVRKTDALLAEAQIAVYPIAAEGVATGSLYDSDQRSGAVVSGQMAAQPLPPMPGKPAPQSAEIQQENKSVQYDALQRNANHTTMDEIARDTGGEAIYNTNGLNDALAQVADHGSYYYTLSYTPTNTATDGRFRKIQVKLATGSYKLAYRRGYYAADAKTLKAEATKPAADPLRPYMRPGTPDSTQIPLALRVQRSAAQADAATNAGDNGKLKGPLTRYFVDYVIAARGLQFDTTPDGARHGKIEAAMVVYDQDGKPLNWMVKQVNLDIDAARYAEVQENGVNFRLEIDVPKDGVSLRSGVYDRESDLAGTLEVPLSAVVSATQTASSK